MNPQAPPTFLGLRRRYWILALGMSAALLLWRLEVRTIDRFSADVGAVGAYVTAIGTLYGILAAFTIYVVWTQFNDAQTAVDTEANELQDLFRFAIYLRDPAVLDALQTAIIEYSASVVRDEWPAMSAQRTSDQSASHFESIFQAVHAVRFDDERDASAWEKMIGKFEAASDARSKRLALSVSTVPRLLRVLIYLVSFALIVGFFVMFIVSDIVAVVVTVATTAIVFLVIEVIEDLDDPFGGQWALTPDPFSRLPLEVNALRGEQ